MKISHDGMTITFKTKPESLFEDEKRGAKQNIVRVLNAFEAEQMRRNPPTKIIIRRHQERFSRILTHIHFDYTVLKNVLVTFSWTNESDKSNVSEISQPACIISSCEEPPIDVTTSAILLPRGLIADLIGFRGNRTVPEFLSELLADYKIRLENREQCGFVEITVTEPMQHKLQKIAYGRSMNSTIHYLYQLYLATHTEEGRLLDDQ